jgi:hypothetical protein
MLTTTNRDTGNREEGKVGKAQWKKGCCAVARESGNRHNSGWDVKNSTSMRLDEMKRQANMAMEQYRSYFNSSRKDRLA